MTCRELAEILFDYIQGELDAELCRHIDQHLLGCSPCTTYVETYRITIQLTRKLPQAPLPPELAERLQRAMREVHKREDSD
jgi:anti-sigma factor RsiW